MVRVVSTAALVGNLREALYDRDTYGAVYDVEEPQEPFRPVCAEPETHPVERVTGGRSLM